MYITAKMAAVYLGRVKVENLYYDPDHSWRNWRTKKMWAWRVLEQNGRPYNYNHRRNNGHLRAHLSPSAGYVKDMGPYDGWQTPAFEDIVWEHRGFNIRSVKVIGWA
jgi:hypothetical protein